MPSDSHDFEQPPKQQQQQRDSSSGLRDSAFEFHPTAISARMTAATEDSEHCNERAPKEPASNNRERQQQQRQQQQRQHDSSRSPTRRTTSAAITTNCTDNEKAGDDDGESITIIHFNDCYNIEPGPESSGAAGFLTAVNQFRHLNPIVLFSGDILSPSFMSTFTKGEQMIPVLNDIGVHCAVFGNHEFDYGVDNLIEFTRRTTFPWLLSNVVDKETSNQLGDGLVYHVIERAGLKIGLIGLIEEEWLSTLSTLDSSDVIYEDFVAKGRELARWLKAERRADYVIALTHFRTPNDIRLADSVPEIDLILGGHDHDYEIIQRPNCYVIKSGTDFRQFSLIKLKLNAQYLKASDASSETSVNETITPGEAVNGGGKSNGHARREGPATTCGRPVSEIAVKRVECLACPPDPVLKSKLDKFVTSIDEKMGKVLGQFNCELDGRFSSIRKGETNLGNFVCDIMLASTHADLAILNSGTLRSDRVHPKGDFTMRDLFNILGYIDPIAVLQATGYHVWRALENGVSQWPKLEGRFPQVSGCSFVFDPTKPPLARIDPKHVLIGEEPLDLRRHYKLTTKAYLASGKDGYDVLKECKVLVPGDESPDLTTSILNHFEAIQILKSNRRTHHRQSLICLSRSSIRKLLDQDSNTTSSPTSAADKEDMNDSSAAEQTNSHRRRARNDDNNNNNNNNNNNGSVLDSSSARLQADLTTVDERLILRSSTASSLDANEDEQLGERHEATPNLNNKLDKAAPLAKGPSASSPLVGLAAPSPSLSSMFKPISEDLSSSCDGCGTAMVATPPSAILPRRGSRQPRTKRLMSLYEMECEQCKLEPKIEGRIKILGVNYHHP